MPPPAARPTDRLDLWNARYGVTAARRGWVRRGEVLNTLPLARFLEAVRPTGRERP